MRKINVSGKAAKAAKPATKPVATPAKPAPVAAAPVTSATPAPVPAVAKPVRGVAATARTIAAQATHFGGLSDRDAAYLTFYAGFAKRGNGTVTVTDIATSGLKPAYAGSAKPHDAGVIVRLGKAGLLTATPDGASFTFTPAAKSHAAYAAGK